MKIESKKINVCWLLILAILLVGCTPAPIDVNINAAANLNQDQAGKSLPIQVKIYQLRDKNAFQQATFRQLWQDDQAVLNKDILDKQQLTVKPNSKKTTVLKRNKDCRYVGVIAIFRRPQADAWRALYIIPDNLSIVDLDVEIYLQNNKLTVKA
ncbi:MAG: type VI secretion system lipoprotein TssJ, partial [Gammaproteobacteria bacterium]|nr:type VI secretion system lipoprotein TssJ [Gammaproteobacteria bacterium]